MPLPFLVLLCLKSPGTYVRFTYNFKLVWFNLMAWPWLESMAACEGRNTIFNGGRAYQTTTYHSGRHMGSIGRYWTNEFRVGRGY